MVDSNSFSSDRSSSSYNTNPDPLPSNCTLCKVKLNQPGICHTRSINCFKCKKKICTNCISQLQKFKDLHQKVCKSCGHKELLFTPEDREMETMATERFSLRMQLKKISDEKNIVQKARIQVLKEFESKKSEGKVLEFEEELQELRENNQICIEKVGELRKELEICNERLKALENDFEEEERKMKTEENWFWFDDLPLIDIQSLADLPIRDDKRLKDKSECLLMSIKLNHKLAQNKFLENLNEILQLQLQDNNKLLMILESMPKTKSSDLTNRKCTCALT